MTDLTTLRGSLLAQVDAAANEAALEALRVAALGKKGSVSELLKTLGSMSPEERKERGPLINGLRDTVQAAIAARRDALASAALEARLASERVDVTLPVREGPETRGRIHPISQVIDELTTIFADMGFAVAEGPDIETDDYNFTALNFPPGHPAREMHDTFFLQPDRNGERRVLRTHTSPVQVRVMTSQPPPIYSVMPGRVFRQDTADATHLPVFHQIEGLVVDRGITLTDLAGTIDRFTKAYFGGEFSSRLRPAYFPFTEPSAEFDIIRPDGTFLELGGCGMVHPNVLRNCGIDPEEFTGFAFGFGIERLATTKAGVNDLRELITNDIRFLKQF